MSTIKSRIIALPVAVLALTAAACEGVETGSVSESAAPADIQFATSCDDGPDGDGVRGKVVGAEWVDPDGVTCLEIETKDDDLRRGDTTMIRVPRRVFDRCLEGERYPRCARTED